MLDVWRVVPALNSALLVLVATVSSLILLESAEAGAAADLGYRGEVLRVVAVPDDNFVGNDRLTDTLGTLSDRHALSIAYSRSFGSGVISILDGYGRFRDDAGDLAARLGPVGAEPTAVVSSALEGSSAASSALAGAGGVVVTGSFDSEVLFDGWAPAVVFNVDAFPFGEGVYLIAGSGLSSGDGETARLIAQAFRDSGVTVIDMMPLDHRTGWDSLLRSLSTPYGVVYLLFGGVVLLTQAVVLRIYVETFRERLLVLAVLGSTRHRVRSYSLRRLASQVSAGSVIGGALSLILLLSADGASLLEPARRLTLVPLALIWGLGTSAAIGLYVSWRAARGVARVVPA